MYLFFLFTQVMLRFFSLLFFGLTLIWFPFISQAVEQDTSTELSLKSVSVVDSKKVRITFSDGIDMTSIVLKISKQSDNSTVVISDMSPVKDIPESVDIILTDDLEEWSSYTLTVQAAIGTSGSTIVDGAGALKEFVTPSPLKKATTVLNAPPNPTAVVAQDDPEETETPVEEDVPVEPVEETPVPTEELPLTGMNPIIFLLFALPFSYILLRKKNS